MKVYVVGYQWGYTRWIKDCTLVDRIQDADIVFFTGGGDISPKYYGCEQHPATWPSIYRDQEEIDIFSQISKDQLVVGVCRGLQLICVMYGGLLIQDVTNHCGSKHTITNGTEFYEVTSLHHQMIYPWNLDPKDYDILYWTKTKRSKYYEGDKIDSKKIIVEPEVVVFHRQDMPICLGIQSHPEMMLKQDPFVIKLNELLLNYGKEVQL